MTGQAVELAAKVSDQFAKDTNNDGLLGLSFSSINTVKPKAQTTWFDTGKAQSAFDKNVFTADLKAGAPGTYDFGYIDSSKYTGDIVYTDVDSSQGFWEFTGTGYGVGSGSFKQQSIDAIADTGTTLLLMDDAIVTDYYKNIKGAQMDQTQGGYVFPCSAKIPDMVLGIGKGKATIPGTLMSLGKVDSSNCFGGLQSNSGIGLSIYGDIFLKAVFAVFDADNSQFGFAPKAGASNSTGSTGGSSSGSNNGTDTGSNDGSDDGSNDGSDDGSYDDGSDDGSYDDGSDDGSYDGSDDGSDYGFGGY